MLPYRDPIAQFQLAGVNHRAASVLSASIDPDRSVLSGPTRSIPDTQIPIVTAGFFPEMSGPLAQTTGREVRDGPAIRNPSH
ncbi:hypothetical protein SAMN05444581_1481 [Methylocapsa palsarum]|uniref:Uncharacterized protein n=1 Tax=Methylocapsa palsarum TaxID=1612308 RepID=A0A1I4DB80_9HYPH|nr:hypothetical protein SAMN05444581_1481 [Methylocapsa palsarum]